MPSVEEIAYREAVRALEGQAQDLEQFRSHSATALTAGGIIAAFFGVQAHGQGAAFWVAVCAFAGIVVLTILMHDARDFGWDFHAHDLVKTYVASDPQWDPDRMMRELAVHAGTDYNENRKQLHRLAWQQRWVLLLLGIEVIALLVNLVVE